VIHASKAEEAKKEKADESRKDTTPSPRSKSSITPRKSLNESPTRRPQQSLSPPPTGNRARASSDADRTERPPGVAPVPSARPAGAAPRPNARAPAPPGTPAAAPAVVVDKAQSQRVRAQDDSVASKPAGGKSSKLAQTASPAPAGDDEETEKERLEWERILAEEREKAKKKGAKK
jgi:hypothetical protein